tara:strand:- start:60127 stop:60648 length:522 start_codon:yes stop_codon:yes gene_type:complete
MRKQLLFRLLFIAFTAVSFGQNTSFGVTAGYVNGNAKLTIMGDKNSEGQSGLYGGITINNEITEKLHFAADLVFMSIDGSNFLQAPLMIKFYPVNKFYLQAGPQITYTLEEIFEDFTKFNIGAGAGVGFDITSKVYVNAKYVFQLNNYFNGPDNAQITSKIDFFNAGLGYRFN